MAKVALCQDAMVEYMGFMCISAVLKQAGHSVEVFIDNQTNESRFMRQLADFQPDVVGFSVMTPSAPWAVYIGKRVKEEIGALTVYGNIHAITSPDIIHNEGVDIVCIGEGEYCMLELCNALDKGDHYTHIEGFWVKTPDGVVRNPMRQELVVLDEMPFHDRQLYDQYALFRRSHCLRILTGRGCPFRCSYCDNGVLMDHYGGKRYIRKRSPESAIAEIEHTISHHPAKVKAIYFQDEVLWVRNEWLRRFLPLYKECIGLPFSACFRFGRIQEEDVKLLAEAGATVMAVYFETGDEEQRRDLLNKPVTNAHILEVTRWMHEYGIEFMTSAMFGLPGDTFENRLEQLDFYRKVNPLYLWTAFFQPYPNVPLAQHEEAKRYLPENKEFPPTVHHDMYLDLPDRERLTNLKKVYFLCMKFPRLEPLLAWLTKFRIPVLFDVLFLLHFVYYSAFRAERVSLWQLLDYLKTFGLNPVLRKKRPVCQNIVRRLVFPWRNKAIGRKPEPGREARVAGKPRSPL